MNSVKVEDLVGRIENERVALAPVRDIEFSDDGLKVPNVEGPLVVDDWATKKLGGFLDVPWRYLSKCPSGFKEETVNFWLQSRSEQEAYVHYRGSDLLGIYPNTDSIVTHSDLARRFLERFDGQDDVREYHVTPEILQLDVTSPGLNVLVPTRDRQGIDPQVGDVTDGGIRLVAYAPNDSRRPYVQYYLHRLVCSNGMTMEEPTARFYGKGKTRGEIVDSLSTVVSDMLQLVPSKLENYASLDDHAFDGNITALIARLAKENGIANRVLDKLLEDAASLPDEPSLYDIANVFTYTANHVLRGTRMKLQSLGGWVVESPQSIIHRCTRCEQVLTDAS